MTEQEKEGNRIVAEYMGYKIGVLSGWITGEGTEESAYKKDENDSINDVLGKISSLKYHSSWEWQIPAWSKLMKEARSTVTPSLRSKFVKQYDSLCFKYALCVNHNQPEEGFKILLEAIKWYNSNKQQDK